MIPVPDPAVVPTVSVPDGGAWFGLGRSASYAAAATGELPTIRIGRTIRVPVARARQMLGLDPEPEAASVRSAPVVPMIKREGE